MKEYWVNVYPHELGKYKYSNVYAAKDGSRVLDFFNTYIKFKYKDAAIYRIHVKIKDEKR